MVAPSPDFLIWALLARLAEHAALVDAVDLGAVAARDRQVVVRLIRAAAVFPGVGVLVGQMLTQKPDLVGAAIEAAVLIGADARRVEPVLTAALSTRESSLPAEELSRLLQLLGDVTWLHLRVALWQTNVRRARALLAENDTTDGRAQLAGSLDNLGVMLEGMGQPDAGRECRVEAVARWWDLSLLRPGEYDDIHARAQARLGQVFAERNYPPGDALRAVQQAARRFRIGPYRGTHPG